jgi:hypothetical protein
VRNESPCGDPCIMLATGVYHAVLPCRLLWLFHSIVMPRAVPCCAVTRWWWMTWRRPRGCALAQTITRWSPSTALCSSPTAHSQVRSQHTPVVGVIAGGFALWLWVFSAVPAAQYAYLDARIPDASTKLCRIPTTKNGHNADNNRTKTLR